MKRRSFIKSLLSALAALFAPAFAPREVKAVMYLAPFVPSAPASPFTAVYDIAQLGERLDVPVGSVGYGDGPTQLQCNKSLQFKWPSNSDTPVTPYGSWIDAAGVQRGTTAFASATIPATGALPLSITWDITTLMRKLVVNNTGVYITPETAGIGAAAAFASKQAVDQTQVPKFHIVTSAGTFDVGAKADSQIVTSSGDAGMDPFMRDPYCIKPDLSTVQGIITSATLTLWDIGGSQLRPCRYDCYYLDMPKLVGDPVRQLGGVQQGIAATVATDDRDLASHPSVIFYPSFANQAAVEAAGWDNWNFSSSNVSFEFVPWNDYGLTAVRLGSPYDGQAPDINTILSARRYFGAHPNEATSPYTELWVRYLMKIDPDVFVGMTEGGVKLPGFEGYYTDPGVWSYRMEHDKQSAENRGAYSWWIHSYDTDNPVGSAFADNRPTSQCALVEGRIYCVEEHVKLNTKTGSTWNADGVVQIWLNGVLVHDENNRRIIGSDVSAGHGLNNFFANFYHGGVGTAPSARIHYEFGGVCVATQYIGPPKRPTSSFPSWRPPAGYFADIPAINTPNDVFDSRYGTNAWTALVSHWNGGAFVRDYSKLGAFCLYGAGHENGGEPNIQGSLTFDFSATKWEYHNGVTNLNPGLNATNCNAADEFADGSLYAGHTYNGIQEFPTSWGGGPKGSVAILYHNGAGTVPGGILRTTHKLDLSQALGGYSRLTEGFGCGIYSVSAMDEGRQGWWLFNSDGTDRTIRFVSKSGAVGPVTSAGYGGGQFTLWPSKDVLIELPTRYWEGDSVTPAVDQIYIYDIKTDVQRTVPTTGKPFSYTQGFWAGIQEMATIAVANGGANYVVGDTLTFATSDPSAPQNSPKVTVTSVGGGGAITGVSFFNFPQAGYTLPQRGWARTPGLNPLSPISTTSVAGTGATFNATWQIAHDFSYTFYVAPRWCEPLRCITFFDFQTGEIATLTPPAGDIYGSAWTYARVAVSHWAAGDPAGQAALNVGAQDAILSKFQYIDTLKAFALFSLITPTSFAYRPPQIITLPGL